MLNFQESTTAHQRTHPHARIHFYPLIKRAGLCTAREEVVFAQIYTSMYYLPDKEFFHILGENHRRHHRHQLHIV